MSTACPIEILPGHPAADERSSRENRSVVAKTMLPFCGYSHDGSTIADEISAILLLARCMSCFAFRRSRSQLCRKRQLASMRATTGRRKIFPSSVIVRRHHVSGGSLRVPARQVGGKPAVGVRGHRSGTQQPERLVHHRFADLEQSRCQTNVSAAMLRIVGVYTPIRGGVSMVGVTPLE